MKLLRIFRIQILRKRILRHNKVLFKNKWYSIQYFSIIRNAITMNNYKQINKWLQRHSINNRVIIPCNKCLCAYQQNMCINFECNKCTNWTLISYAIHVRQYDVIQYLIENDYNYDLFSELYNAVEQNNIALIQMYFDNYNIDDKYYQPTCELFLFAIKQANLETIKCFLENGLNINTKIDQCEVFEGRKNRRYEKYNYVIDPLMAATNYGNKSVIKFLLCNGAIIPDFIFKTNDSERYDCYPYHYDSFKNIHFIINTEHILQIERLFGLIILIKKQKINVFIMKLICFFFPCLDNLKVVNELEMIVYY